MNNFNFHNPTRIVFGEGKVAELDALVPSNARVITLFGGESARGYPQIFGNKTAVSQPARVPEILDSRPEKNLHFAIATGR
jgi:NADP-dependent alcohol dehydrogenase